MGADIEPLLLELYQTRSDCVHGKVPVLNLQTLGEEGVERRPACLRRRRARAGSAVGRVPFRRQVYLRVARGTGACMDKLRVPGYVAIGRYAGRWSLEDTFRNMKQYLGGQEPQTWRAEGPERAAGFSDNRRATDRGACLRCIGGGDTLCCALYVLAKRAKVHEGHRARKKAVRNRVRTATRLRRPLGGAFYRQHGRSDVPRVPRYEWPEVDKRHLRSCRWGRCHSCLP